MLSAECRVPRRWFDPTAKTRTDPSWGYTQYGRSKMRVLHLIGSPTSAYYEKLSIMYAQGCAASNAEPSMDEFEFVYAIVHPEGRVWSFPADLSDATIESAARYTTGQALARLEALDVDVAQVRDTSTDAARPDVARRPMWHAARCGAYPDAAHPGA